MSESRVRQPFDQGENRNAEQIAVDSDAGGIVAALVEAVATRRDVDPLSLDPRLGDVIDADALRCVLRTADEDLEISFEYASCAVTVTGDGELVVRDA